MKKINLFIFAILAISVAFISGCKDDPIAPPVEEEHAPATTVTMYLIKLNENGTETTDTSKVTLRDTSVVKGKPAMEGELVIKTSASYKGTFKLYNESVTPTEDMTQEIVNERNSHMFTFTPDAGLTGKITISDLSKDDNNLQFGMIFKVAASNAAGNGAIKVTLRHYDSGNKNDTQFDTDIERDFPVKIIQ